MRVTLTKRGGCILQMMSSIYHPGYVTPIPCSTGYCMTYEQGGSGRSKWLPMVLAMY